MFSCRMGVEISEDTLADNTTMGDVHVALNRLVVEVRCFVFLSLLSIIVAKEKALTPLHPS